MAANQRAELGTIEQVMAFYEMHSDKPFYVIYAGVNLQPSMIIYEFFDEEQPEQGEEMLLKFLELIKSRPSNTSVYTLQLIDSFKIVDDKGLKVKKYVGRAIRFQLNEPMAYNNPNQSISKTEIMFPNQIGNVSDNELTKMLKMLLEEQKSENEKLRQLLSSNDTNNFDEEYDEEDDEENEDEPEQQIVLTPKERINKVIAGFVEREEVQEAIAGLVVNGANLLFNKFLAPKQTDINNG
jgi:hypothetical protein